LRRVICGALREPQPPSSLFFEILVVPKEPAIVAWLPVWGDHPRRQHPRRQHPRGQRPRRQRRAVKKTKRGVL